MFKARSHSDCRAERISYVDQVYELSLYKPKLLTHFSEWVRQYRDDPLHEDAFSRASRIHALLETLVALPDDRLVPKDSVLREFIGGLVLD